ncbi:MAG: zf-HC2 domain-containing protein [Candidatus Caenarcaniphilales bacterium]|nr:zf-HC2 domain-containing protein [Candidatus Caenarcaniphilales bacterium]
MKFHELEKLSEYFDGESNNPDEVKELIEKNEKFKKVFNNFSKLSLLAKQELGTEKVINDNDPVFTNFWTQLNEELELQEKQLSKILKQSFNLDNVTQEFTNIDLWNNIEKKLEANDRIEAINNSEIKAYDNSSIQNNSTSSSKLSTAQFNTSSNLSALLKNGFELPQNIDSLDIWTDINQELDSQFHEEMFSENSSKDWSIKEKFFVGLSEFIDGEVSSTKAQLINDHILACSSCRKLYLSFSKLKSALKQSFCLDLNQEERYRNFWNDLEDKLFPEEKYQGNSDNVKKVEGL